MRFFVTLLTFLLPSLLLGAADKDKNFEGTVAVTEMRGGVSTQTIYTRKGDQLCIENPDKSKPEPSNIIDLASHKLTIVYPHNSTFVVVDLTKASVQPRAPDLPAGFLTPSPMNQPAGGTRLGPAISPPPGFPMPPPMPSMPPRPNNPMASGMPNPAIAGPMMPSGMPRPPSQGFGAPGMPSMPAMGGFGGAPELKKTDKTRKIQGFDCTLYTISDRMQIFEIWATPDSALFPFRSLERNYNSRHFGPQMLEQRWGELLQKQSLFPLEASLRIELRIPSPSRPGTSPAPNSGATPDPGPPQLAFKVDKIERKKVDDEKLFQPPEGYLEIRSPTS